MPLSTVFLSVEQLNELRKEKATVTGVPQANEKTGHGEALVIEPSGEQA